MCATCASSLFISVSFSFIGWLLCTERIVSVNVMSTTLLIIFKNSEAASHHVHVGFDHCLKCTKVSERYCAWKREPLRAPGRANNARWCHLNPQILLPRVVIPLYLLSRIMTPLPVSLEVAGLGLADRLGAGSICLAEASYSFHSNGILFSNFYIIL